MSPRAWRKRRRQKMKRVGRLSAKLWVPRARSVPARVTNAIKISAPAHLRPKNLKAKKSPASPHLMLKASRADCLRGLLHLWDLRYTVIRLHPRRLDHAT